MLKATCPNHPDHNRFSTVAHIMEEWEVDARGDYVDRIKTLDTTHPPSEDNIWTCLDCGAEAVVKKV